VTYIPLAFHPDNTALAHIAKTTGFDDIKNIAVARLMLDNIPHIKAYWVMMTPRMAQIALRFGADDIDGTIVEERIYHDAGATTSQACGGRSCCSSSARLAASRWNATRSTGRWSGARPRSPCWFEPRASSDRDDWAGRVQPPQVAGIACDDAGLRAPGQDHNRGVDYVGGIGGAAEFSAGTGELFTKRDNLDFVDPQKPRQCDLNRPSRQACPTTPEGTRSLRRCAKARSSRAISRLSPRSRAIKAPASSVNPAGAAAACVLPFDVL